jgi:hypothetical protein
MRADRQGERARITRDRKDKSTGVLRHKGKALGTYSISEAGKTLTIWLYAR